MKTTIICLLSILFLNSHAQIPSIWRGNTPGHEEEWDFPSNWSNNTVPDEFTDVIIPVDVSDSHRYPVLKREGAEINSLRIWRGACLILKGGKLYIMDASGNCYNRSQIAGSGKLILMDDPHYVTNGEAKKREK